ncbi:acyl carrier protein phosphodiesterase [Fulvivirga ligni]|uniref:acyl carrier protein phosphodiesterase n=1 Tax=Fulvivirga ligni TaxID=2904246 RepID=UPI001F1F5DBC|nr:ACP phosphodiesterase [Fulvivirga ligni]UII23477.1 ACP phosphodiesterase [Fulvivirga ligni]
MNLLAHAYLSGENTELLVGNLIGDFVKGKRYEHYSGDLKRGILLHRQIDNYTDAHPLVLESKKRLSQKYRHYSGVIVDLFYDYFLASQWDKFHQKGLKDFSLSVYQSIATLKDNIPSRAKEMFKYMERGDWLYSYQYTEGIDRALTGLSSRTKFESKMDEAVEELIKYEQEFKEEFNEFFPQIKKFTSDWLLNN